MPSDPVYVLVIDLSVSPRASRRVIIQCEQRNPLYVGSDSVTSRESIGAFPYYPFQRARLQFHHRTEQ